jgi:hypothetical protein
MRPVVILFMVFALAAFIGCGDDDDDDRVDEAVDDDDDDDDDDVNDDDVDGDDDDDDDFFDDDEDDDDVDDDVDDDADDDADDDDDLGPDYPQNHNSAWNCYACHDTNFLGVTTPEPHGGLYTAPEQCAGCHQQGDWNNPYYEGGHSWSLNCVNCHHDKHNNGLDEKAQCLVCHGEN